MTTADAPQTALVTGAAGGMGAAISKALLQSGHRVILADRDADTVRKLAAELGDASLALPLDITDKAAVDGIIDNLPPAWRRIDILVNNAGHDIGGRTRFDLGSADDWSAIIETNLIGLMRVTRALLPPMVARDTGDIVNMSSISALRIVPDMAAYTTSKAGVRAFTDVLRGELAETGIRVTEILPASPAPASFARAIAATRSRRRTTSTPSRWRWSRTTWRAASRLRSPSRAACRSRSWSSCRSTAGRRHPAVDADLQQRPPLRRARLEGNSPLKPDPCDLEPEPYFFGQIALAKARLSGNTVTGTPDCHWMMVSPASTRRPLSSNLMRPPG